MISKFLALPAPPFSVFGDSIMSSSMTSLLSTIPQHMLHFTNLFLLFLRLRHLLPTTSYSWGDAIPSCRARGPHSSRQFQNIRFASLTCSYSFSGYDIYCLQHRTHGEMQDPESSEAHIIVRTVSTQEKQGKKIDTPLSRFLVKAKFIP
ncbi:hypothetical protein EUGRSUZ_A01186 [Eucalyptus grandis]|uniref:Uncharacterized protein n=2 Tax=Eucalyptus grandis TaxID=71139 RepID=A0ACC3M2G8_EUCGR|nr:hypothetical protein EUGRSUZ_A01186 [Eucalyptus grandis]